MHRRMSHREFLIRSIHLKHQWNQPSREDYYLMQIAQLICGLPAWVWGKTAKLQDLKKFELPFVFGGHSEEPQKLTEEQQKQIIEQSKARWRALMEATSRGKRN